MVIQGKEKYRVTLITDQKIRITVVLNPNIIILMNRLKIQDDTRT